MEKKIIKDENKIQLLSWYESHSNPFPSHPKQIHWCCCLLSMFSISNFPSISVFATRLIPSCHSANVQALIHSWLTWSIKFHKIHKIKYNFHVEWMLIIYPFVCYKKKTQLELFNITVMAREFLIWVSSNTHCAILFSYMLMLSIAVVMEAYNKN